MSRAADHWNDLAGWLAMAIKIGVGIFFVRFFCGQKRS